nr:SusC/RagA family TonB-linked outer membrane protein [uncultured Flavobacterium sp.]
MERKFTFKLILFFILFYSAITLAQEKQKITGIVTSQDLPLYGVSVMIENTDEGAITEEDGSYAIYAKQGDVLRFSYLGLQDVTKTVGLSIFINVSMNDDSSVLDEIVILGYGQKKNKNELTGNVVQISGDEISKAPLASADQALQGKVAGLTLAGDSGTPGSTQSIRIRGMNSVSASNDPLIVIDGIPVTNSNLTGDANSSSLSALSAINSSDIENITVLKDAGATSVYGARGANGVILITTKRGKSGETRYEFSSSIGFQNNAVKGPTPLSGQKKMDYALEAFNNTYNGGGVFDYDAVYNQMITAMPNETAGLQNWIDQGKPNNDWSKWLQNKDALVNILNFSATGGDEKSNFYASLGYNKTEGTMIGSDFRRVSGLFSFDRQLSDRVDFGFSANVSNIKQEGILEQGAYYSNPNMIRYFMSPWNSAYGPDGQLNINRSLLSGLHNPLYTLPNNIRYNDVIRAISNVKVSYKITEDLRFNTQMALDYNYTYFRNFNNPFHGDGASYHGYAENSASSYFQYNTQNSLDYRFYIADNHRFDVKVLMEYEKMKLNYLYGVGYNIPEGFNMLGNASKDFRASATFADQANLSYLGLINYSFNNKYLVDLSLRREGNSKFSPKNRWGTFWSAGAAWNIMNEEFMIGSETISLLRLRGSYGVTGNSGIGRNKYQNTLVTERYDGQTGFVPGQIGDDITWEKVYKSDIGLNLGFLQNRITASVAYYNSLTKDLLLAVPVTRTSGFVNVLKNAGELKNNGWEFEFSAQVIEKENFSWSVYGNFATLKNKVTSMPIMPDGDKLTPTSSFTRIEEGHPIRGWYMKKYAGVNPETGDAQWYVNGKDGEVTSKYADAKVAWQGGSAIPTYSGGFGTQIEIGNFFVNANLSFSGGNKVYEDWGNYVQGTSSTALLTFNSTDYVDDRWQKPGDITDVPKFTINSNNNASVSTRFLKDGDFVRLRDVSFGYNFDKKDLQQLKLSGLTLSVRGTNLYTWVKDKSLKFDPEVGANASDGSYGYVGFISPPVKSVVFSVNVKF